jgi:hypothetical protein
MYRIDGKRGVPITGQVHHLIQEDQLVRVKSLCNADSIVRSEVRYMPGACGLLLMSDYPIGVVPKWRDQPRHALAK